MTSIPEIIAIAEQLPELAARHRLIENPSPSRETRENPGISIPGRDGQPPDFTAVTATYQWIVNAFRTAMPPDPAGFAGPSQTMASAARALQPVEDQTMQTSINEAGEPEMRRSSDAQKFIDRAEEATNRAFSNRLNTWDGIAAQTFKNEVVAKIPVVVANQAALAASLQSAADGCASIYATALERLRGVAEATRNVLMYRSDAVAPDLSIPLSLAAGGTAVAAAVPGVGTAGILVLAGVGAAASVTKDVMDNAKESAKDRESERRDHETDAQRGARHRKEQLDREIHGYSIGGPTVDAILERTTEAIQIIGQRLADAEDEIIHMLTSNLSLLDDNASTLKDFLSPRPSFIAATTTPEDLKKLRNSPYFTCTTNTRRDEAINHGQPAARS